MKLLVFDTETTGLPEKKATIDELEKWPYIIQISYILYDTDNNYVIDISDLIIKLNENIKINEISESIHKISMKISQQKGIDIKQALLNFKRVVNNSDLIVGHNVKFDKNIVSVELARNNINNFLKTKNFYCTMYGSKNICKIPIIMNGRQIFKYPKLIELYKFYFSDEPQNLHNSMYDVLVTLRCFGMLKYNIDFQEVSCNLNAIITLAGFCLT
tara:strand:- start:1787 stop:2431 length:645 start_codon:yes stop_codon:yes gene_type:complete